MSFKTKLLRSFCRLLFGTHVDFPGHFVKEAPLSEAYGVNEFVFPLVVIDISEKAKAHVDYAVSVEDIKAYEAKYGEIPEGAFVALRTEWYKRWPDMDKLAHVGEDGNEHCPGWSMDALKYIFEERKAAANGHETLDTDASYLAVEAGDLACERYVLCQGKLQIEVLQNLDKVAPAGALLFASWPRI